MSHRYKKEIQEKRIKNIPFDKPTPAKIPKKVYKPFVIQRRFVGVVPENRTFLKDWYHTEWRNIKSFAKLQGAEQSLKSELQKGWFSDKFEYRILNLEENNH